MDSSLVDGADVTNPQEAHLYLVYQTKAINPTTNLNKRMISGQAFSHLCQLCHLTEENEVCGEDVSIQAPRTASWYISQKKYLSIGQSS
ncbi:hypothetical protein AgCh_024992 [Apium graveolens]